MVERSCGEIPIRKLRPRTSTTTSRPGGRLAAHIAPTEDELTHSLASAREGRTDHRCGPAVSWRPRRRGLTQAVELVAVRDSSVTLRRLMSLVEPS